MDSIWRWAITDNLEQLFTGLVGADNRSFAATAGEIARGPQSEPDMISIAAKTEAKYRAMGLPEDVLATMLKGLKTMVEEAQAVQELADDDADDVPSVALASSHVFSEEPFATLSDEEISRQVTALVERYKDALDKAFGAEGVSMENFLGLPEGRLLQDDGIEFLKASNCGHMIWLWSGPVVVHVLSRWRENRDLPIDLEFSRVPQAAFEELRDRARRL